MSAMTDHDTISTFKKLVSQDMAVPVAAMSALIQKMKDSRASTWMELEHELRSTIESLLNCDIDILAGRSHISVGSGCDLFMKYVTRSFNLDNLDFSQCRTELLKRGEKFTGMSLNARIRIADIGQSFIEDNCTVLIHGTSRVVLALILTAAKSKFFNVIVTEAKPSTDGIDFARAFASAGIPTKVVLDSAVGAIMEEVDFCLVGAEGVMENGGIVNRIGTYQIALVAKALQRPFYVAVESYKFARMYPLSQRDIHNLSTNIKTQGNAISPNVNFKKDFPNLSVPLPENLSVEVKTIDFTPSNLITLLFTDLGVLTPAAVSDELIRLYQ